MGDASGGGDRRELVVDLADQRADGERADFERPRTSHQPRVIEMAARQAEQVVAKLRHRSHVPGLVGRNRTGCVVEQQVEPRTKGNERAAKLTAEVGEDRLELAVIDKSSR